MHCEEDIHDAIAAILWVLYLSGYDELEMPAAIAAEHQILNADQELYLCVWGLLDSKTRAAFKAWLTYDYYRRTSGESSPIPEGYRLEVWEAQGPCGVLRGKLKTREGSADVEPRQ
jgi:hypothetical protein